jgi:hypothetical protein
MRRWLARMVIAGCVWAAVIGYAELTDRRPHLLALAGAVVALMTLVWLVADVLGLADPVEWSLYRAPSPDRTFDPRFSRLSQELAEASDRHAASVALHASLSAVADRILLDTYDVDRAADPSRARDILGDDTVWYLEAEPGAEKVVFSARVSAVLDRLESL